MQGLQVQRHDVNFHGKTPLEPPPQLPTIGGIDEETYTRDYYLPTWQISPVMANGPAYNWDFSAIYNNPIYVQETIERQRVTIAECYNLPKDNDEEDTAPTKSNDNSVDEATRTIQQFVEYLDPSRDPKEPLSDILYPIVDSAPDTVSYGNQTGRSVGIMIATVFWSDLLKGVLPEGTNGFVFVFENPCHQTFSYVINGPTVRYLGRGDWHVPRYDHLEQSKSFAELSQAPGSVYTSLPLSDKGCSFHLRVYPSAVSRACLDGHVDSEK